MGFGKRRLSPAISFGFTAITFLVLVGCAHLGVPSVYKRSYQLTNCSITVSEWVKAGTDDEGEYAEVKMNYFNGRSCECRFEIWGRVVDSWVTDLDHDGNPDVVVVSRSFGTGVYGELYVVRKVAKGLAVVKGPELAAGMARGYEGHDEYKQHGDRRIERTFPIRDADERYSGGGRRIIYAFENNKLDPVMSQDVRGLSLRWLPSRN
ncbi:MAG: hypothetical protein WCO77_11455 [bacterium]